MKWKLRSSVLKVLMNYYAKLNGLAPFNIENGIVSPPDLTTKIYAVILAAVNFICMIMGFADWYEKTENTREINSSFSWRSRKLNVFADGVASSVTPIALLIFHKKFVYLMNELNNVNGELAVFGTKKDCEKLTRKYFTIAVITNIVSVLKMVSFYLVGSKGPFDYVLIYFTVRDVINLNTILTFAQIISHIGQAFEMANEQLRATFEPSYEQFESPIFVIYDSKSRREINREDCNGSPAIQRISIIKALHLKLCDLLNCATSLFALPILLNSCRIFSNFVLYSYWIHGMTFPKIYEPHFWGLCISEFAILSQLVMMTYAVETTCKIGNATKIVLLRTWNKLKLFESQNEILTFSVQLLHTPVAVSILGFLDLDYSLIYKMLLAAVTYFIIVIQFDK